MEDEAAEDLPLGDGRSEIKAIIDPYMDEMFYDEKLKYGDLVKEVGLKELSCP